MFSFVQREFSPAIRGNRLHAGQIQTQPMARPVRNAGLRGTVPVWYHHGGSAHGLHPNRPPLMHWHCSQ